MTGEEFIDSPAKGKSDIIQIFLDILGVSQPRVSDLTRGEWEKFSLEMLITLATRAGMRISL